MIGFGRHSAIELPEQLDALREAVDLADGRLDADHVAFGRHVIIKADQRLRHGTTHTLAALLGATGAGKSSLANALVGTNVATTGVRRPTTSSTLAAVWGGPDEIATAAPLLDWLEVSNRHNVGPDPQLDGLIVLDVPDHDSVEVSHRLEMERIAEHVDLLIWVTDPEKYADAALHHYLRFLAGHQAVTIVVLNKADNLEAADLNACRTDLSRILVEDGISSAMVVAVSATTGAGVDELGALLAKAVADQHAMVDRLQADVAVAASELAADVGAGSAHKLTEQAVDRLTDDLVDAAGIEAVTDAVAAGARRDAATAMGWPFTRWTGRLRPHPLRRLRLDGASTGRSSLPAPTGSQLLRAEGSIRTFTDELSVDLDKPWPDLIRQAGTPDTNILSDRLDTAVSTAVRDLDRRRPRWWGGVGVIQWLLAVATLAGGVWLAVLFGLAWLQVPEPPTPEYRGLPIPTLLLLVGGLAGLLLSFIGRRVASVSARRAANHARKAAAANVRLVADELVVAPVRSELEGRDRLIDLLQRAGADTRLATKPGRADHR